VICWSAFAAIAEATRLASNAGVDASRLPEALAGGWADSIPFQIFVPRMLAGVSEPLGHTDTALKDIDSAMELGRAAGAPLPMTATVQQLFRLLLAQGHAKSEPSVLYELYGEGPTSRSNESLT
jgi:3-hydroxyisobutyrate dehydrogenase